MTALPLSNSSLPEKVGITENDSDRLLDDAEDSDAFTKDDVFHLLQNERRRRVIAYLHEHDDGDGVDMRDAVESIAAREHDTTVQALRSKERQRVYIALYQSHLPKLDEAGFIDYDKRLGWIERTEASPIVERYVVGPEEATEDALDPQRYASVATVFGALLLGVGLLGVVPALTSAFVSVVIFALLCSTALWHRYTAPE